MSNVIDLNNKKSRKFIALIKNTKTDLLQNISVNEEIMDSLNEIINTKKLTLFSALQVSLIINKRKENIDYIKNIQDEYSFKLVNEEHKYMDKFLRNYFEINNESVSLENSFMVIKTIDRNIKIEDSNMKKTSISYNFLNQLSILITSYNKSIFSSEYNLLSAYELVFFDFLEYTYKTRNKDLLSFLKDSVKNNTNLSDYLEEIDFAIKDDCIEFQLNSSNYSYKNNGSFILDRYIINVCFSYLFINDTKTNKKYLYYGD